MRALPGSRHGKVSLVNHCIPRSKPGDSILPLHIMSQLLPQRELLSHAFRHILGIVNGTSRMLIWKVVRFLVEVQDWFGSMFRRTRVCSHHTAFAEAPDAFLGEQSAGTDCWDRNSSSGSLAQLSKAVKVVEQLLLVCKT